MVLYYHPKFENAAIHGSWDIMSTTSGYGTKKKQKKNKKNKKSKNRRSALSCRSNDAVIVCVRQNVTTFPIVSSCQHSRRQIIYSNTWHICAKTLPPACLKHVPGDKATGLAYSVFMCRSDVSWNGTVLPSIHRTPPWWVDENSSIPTVHGIM